MNTNNLGFAWTMYPWGISMGYVQAYREGQEYQIGALPTDTAALSITTREFNVGVSRVLFENRLSLGVDLVLGQAEREITSALVTGGSSAHHGYALGARVGAMLQLPERFLLGASYSLPMHHAVDPSEYPTQGVTNFFQPIDVPETFAVGLGWIPNRHFRTDLTVYSVGTTPNAALLSHNSVEVGRSRTYHPRLGASYVFADFKEFSATAFAGTYYEASRIRDSNGRFHFTSGLEVKPWILSLGWAMDTAPDYRNYLVSVSIDVIKTMTKLELIPKLPSHHSEKFLPEPGYLSDAGLARPLVRHWKPQREIDPISAGLAVPSKIAEKIENVGNAVANVFAPEARASEKPTRPAAPKPVPPPPEVRPAAQPAAKNKTKPVRQVKSGKRKPASEKASSQGKKNKEKSKKKQKKKPAKPLSRPEPEHLGRPIPTPSPPPPKPKAPPEPPAPLKPIKSKVKFRDARDAPEEPGNVQPAPTESEAPRSDEKQESSE